MRVASPCSIIGPNGTTRRSSGLSAGSQRAPCPSSGPGKRRRSPCDEPVRQADALVVGAGPNGLVAALTLARAGLAVDVYEAANQPGGGCRTAELTLPGFRHDVCSAVHPLLVASPAFADVDLLAHGVRLLTPTVAFAHPLDGGRAVCVGHSVDDVADSLGEDGPAYARTFSPLARNVDKILPAFLGSMRSLPAHPLGRRRTSGCAASRRPNASPTGSAPRRGGRSWPAPPPTPCCPSRRRSRASSRGSSRRSPIAIGWPVVEGGSGGRRRRPRGRAHGARRAHRDGPPGEAAGRPALRRGLVLDVTPRQLLELAGDACRPVPQGPLPLPLRARRLQGRLGAERTGALDRRRLSPGGDAPRRRHVRGDRPRGGRRERGRHPCSPVLLGDAAVRRRLSDGHRRDGTRCGPTVTSPTVPTWT